MLVRKAFKFRIYPTMEQRRRLAVQFGHARFVYNHYLALRNKTYEETGRSLNYTETAGDMRRLKADPEFAWLREADSQVLQQSLMDLQKAFDNFFRKHKNGTLPAPGKKRCKDGKPRGFPKFKSKRDRQSIRYPQRFKVEDGKVYLPKVGRVKLVQHRSIEGVMKNCTVSKTKTGKYFVSIQCELEMPDPELRPGRIGVDLGLIHFITTSEGEKVPTPRHLRRAERRVKIRQRRLSRKAKGSNNRSKARRRVAVQYERVANQRRDFHHKLSRDLVGRYGYIAFENLNITGMLKNHALAKSIADAGWRLFVEFCRYKAKWSGGVVVNADRFFASTKTCSTCGHINHDLQLSERRWTCPGCGVTRDRDKNAAANILNATTVGATESHACGDTIPVCLCVA